MYFHVLRTRSYRFDFYGLGKTSTLTFTECLSGGNQSCRGWWISLKEVKGKLDNMDERPGGGRVCFRQISWKTAGKELQKKKDEAKEQKQKHKQELPKTSAELCSRQCSTKAEGNDSGTNGSRNARIRSRRI